MQTSCEAVEDFYVLVDFGFQNASKEKIKESSVSSFHVENSVYKEEEEKKKQGENEDKISTSGIDQGKHSAVDGKELINMTTI